MNFLYVYSILPIFGLVVLHLPFCTLKNLRKFLARRLKSQTPFAWTAGKLMNDASLKNHTKTASSSLIPHVERYLSSLHKSWFWQMLAWLWPDLKTVFFPLKCVKS